MSLCLDEQGNKSLAGKLIVKANDDKHRYALDVVMVNVKTCIKDDNLSSPPPNPSRKTTLQKYFSQCYIDANIEECELDLTTPDQKEAFLAYTDEELLKRKDLGNLKIYDYLTSVLSSNPDTAKYASYYRFCWI